MVGGPGKPHMTKGRLRERERVILVGARQPHHRETIDEKVIDVHSGDRLREGHGDLFQPIIDRARRGIHADNRGWRGIGAQRSEHAQTGNQNGPGQGSERQETKAAWMHGVESSTTSLEC